MLTRRLRILLPSLIVIALLLLIPLFALLIVARYNADLVTFAETQADRSVGLTVQEVLESIASGSEGDVLGRIRQAKVYAEDGVMELFVELWERRIDQHPALDWDLLDTEEIRVELADVLADASRKNRVEMTLEPLLGQFRQSAVFAENDLVQHNAIFNVGLFDDPADVPLLMELILAENESTHRLAMLALAGMCNEEARESFSALYQTLPAERTGFIQEAANRFEGWTDESDWCRCRLLSCPEPNTL